VIYASAGTGSKPVAATEAKGGADRISAWLDGSPTVGVACGQAARNDRLANVVAVINRIDDAFQGRAPSTAARK
jgi:hypothetical protein